MTDLRRVLRVVLTVLAAPAIALAQPVAAFDRLADVLNGGDQVRVIQWTGVVVHGKVAALTPDAIALAREGGATERIARADVREISARRRDSLQNGAAIGFAATTLVTCFAGSPDDGATCVAGAVILGGLGASAGMLIDAAIRRRVVVFRAAERSAVIEVRPTGRGLAAGAVLRW